jgi:2-polyprenyl-3-methyl-5-hydroxy-6-metoxy-1,4-benzoquinol methylase
VSISLLALEGNQMDEAEYLTRIDSADQNLRATAHQPGQGRGSEVQLDEALAWPGTLQVVLRESTDAELLRLQYVTERHYAGQLKSAEDDVLQDELLALAYLRVVRLQFLRHEPDMGFTKRELEFVLAVVRQSRAAEARDPDVLEVGCGAGSLLESLAESGLRSLAGIDLAPSAVELTRKRLAPYGLADNVQQATVPHLIRSGRAGTFDIVLLCDVIEHVPPSQVESLLADVRTLLRADGRLIAISPNAFAGPHDITRHFQAPGSQPEGLHLHEYSLRELTDLLRRTGFAYFTGLRLRDCMRWPGEQRLSALSVRIRLAMERVFPYTSLGLTRRAVNDLYFSAICGQVSRDWVPHVTRGERPALDAREPVPDDSR